MHELYELKEMLLEELKEYGKKELTTGSLAAIDTLAHATKNLCKIIESAEEGGGSYEGSYEGSYRRGSYEGGSNRRGSYEGSYRRRDSMGRYAREGGGYSSSMADKLRGMMQDAPDEKTRNELQKMIGKLEDMER